MSEMQLSCPSCGMIIEVKREGMHRCKYCREDLYAKKEEYGYALVLASEDSDEYGEESYGAHGEESYDGQSEDLSRASEDLEEGERKLPPDFWEVQKRKKRKLGPVSFVSVLVIIGIAMSPLIKELRVSSRVSNEPQTRRTQAPKVKKQFASEVNSDYMKEFVMRAFQKEWKEIGRSDYERVRYLKVWMPEYNSAYFMVDYALDAFDAFDRTGAVDERALKESERIRQMKIFLKKDEPFVLPLFDFQPFSKLQILDLKDSESLVDTSGFEEEYEFHLKNLDELQALFLPDYSRIDRVNELIPQPQRLVTLAGGLYNADLLQPVLYRFENLRHLEITYINDSNVKEMAQLGELKQLESLKIPSLEDNSYLKELKTLKSLEIRFHDEKEDLSFLSEMPFLESLVLKRARKIKNLDFISNLPHLKRFGISHSEIVDLSPLKNLNLEVLELRENIEVEDYSPVSEMTSLQRLDINVAVPEARVKFFSISKLAQLKELAVASAWIARLGNSGSVERLRLYTGVWSDFYMEDIPKMPHLREILFEDKGTLHHAQSLKRFEKLERLIFYKSKLQYFDLAQLLSHPSLKSLNFHDVDAFAINREALKPNFVLENLNIDHADRLFLIDPSGGNVSEQPHRFGEFPEIFTNLKALKSLVIRDSGIKNTNFIQEMPALTLMEVDQERIYRPSNDQ